MAFSSLMSKSRDRLENLRINVERFQLVGGLPKKRLKFLTQISGKTEGVVWERSGEVRTLPPAEYLEDPR